MCSCVDNTTRKHILLSLPSKFAQSVEASVFLAFSDTVYWSPYQMPKNNPQPSEHWLQWTQSLSEVYFFTGWTRVQQKKFFLETTEIKIGNNTLRRIWHPTVLHLTCRSTDYYITVTSEKWNTRYTLKIPCEYKTPGLFMCLNLAKKVTLLPQCGWGGPSRRWPAHCPFTFVCCSTAWAFSFSTL